MTNDFYKFKSYAHFDKRISIEYGRTLAENPEYVSSHGFYPFLHFTLKLNRFKPKKETSEEKREPKLREIYYAAHQDRYIYQFYSHLLNNAYNKYCSSHGIDDCSVAYRTNKKGKCNIDFANEAFSFLQKHNNCLILIGDFTSFFDNLDHTYLLQCIKTVLNTEKLTDDWYAVYKNICHFSSIDIKDILEYYKSQKDNNLPQTKHQLDKREIAFPLADIRKKYSDWIHPNKNLYGIPQGSPISGILANVYMIEFDRLIKDLCDKNGGLYRRYSDDFIIIFPNIDINAIETNVETIFKVKSQIAAKGKLDLQKEKTKCYFFADNQVSELSFIEKQIHNINPIIKFLGFSFDGINIDFRDKTKAKNTNKIIHKIRRLYKLQHKHRKNGAKIFISYKSVKSIYGTTYTHYIDRHGQDKTKPSFNSYVKKSYKIFKGSTLINARWKNKRARLNRLINKTIDHCKK